MKNVIITIALIFGIAIGASAQRRGLFEKGPESDGFEDAYERTYGSPFILPQYHGLDYDGEAPLGDGTLLLLGLGAAYTLKKRKQVKNEP